MNKNIRKKAKFMVKHFRGNKIADFGSEDINWDESLHANMEKIYGRKIWRIDKYGQPDFVQDLNDSEYNFEDEQFDTIIASEVIEHLENPLHFLRELRRLIKPDGQILLTTPNAVSLAELQCAIQSRGRHNKEYTEHLYNWHRGNMKVLASEANLEIKKFKYISFYWRKNILFRLIAWILPFLRPNMFVVLEKSK